MKLHHGVASRSRQRATVDLRGLQFHDASEQYPLHIWCMGLVMAKYIGLTLGEDVPLLDLDLIALQFIDLLSHQFHLLHLGGHCIVQPCQLLLYR